MEHAETLCQVYGQYYLCLDSESGVKSTHYVSGLPRDCVLRRAEGHGPLPSVHSRSGGATQIVMYKGLRMYRGKTTLRGGWAGSVLLPVSTTRNSSKSA